MPAPARTTGRGVAPAAERRADASESERGLPRRQADRQLPRAGLTLIARLVAKLRPVRTAGKPPRAPGRKVYQPAPDERVESVDASHLAVDPCAGRQPAASAALNGCRAFVDVARPLPWVRHGSSGARASKPARPERPPCLQTQSLAWRVDFLEMNYELCPETLQMQMSQSHSSSSVFTNRMNFAGHDLESRCFLLVLEL